MISGTNTQMFIHPAHNDSLLLMFILRGELLMICPRLFNVRANQTRTGHEITHTVSIEGEESAREADKEKARLSDRQKRREDEQSRGSTLTY